MAKKEKSSFSNFDTPYQVQPPAGSAEGGIEYGGVANVAGREPNDPMGVMPDEATGKNIGPRSSEG